MAPYDNDVLVGVKKGIEKVNAEGKVKVNLVEADSKTDPAESAKAGLKVLDQGADMVVTSCDFDIGGPAAVEAQKQSKLGLGTCAASLSFGVQGIGPLAFTMSVSAFTSGAVMAEWGYKKKGYRSAYILRDTTLEFDKQTCQGFRDRFKELGGKIVGEDTFTGAEPIQAQVTNVKAVQDQIDVIFLCSIQPGGASALRQLRGAGIDTPVMSTDNFDGYFWKKGVPKIGELYYDTYRSIWGDDPDPEVNEFVKAFKEQTGKDLQYSGAFTGYALVEVVAQALEKAGSTDGPALQKVMESPDAKFDTLIGDITFTPERHIGIDRPLAVLQAKDDETVFLENWDPEKVPNPLFPEG
jgi:branched-chain amino acid transport system substrate-binding protein